MPEKIEEGGASAVDPVRDRIREVFLRNGFVIKPGKTDLAPYVYSAARELLAEIAAVGASRGEAVYLYRRLGWHEFATCDRSRYVELSSHRLFETRVLYTATPAAQRKEARP